MTRRGNRKRVAVAAAVVAAFVLAAAPTVAQADADPAAMMACVQKALSMDELMAFMAGGMDITKLPPETMAKLAPCLAATTTPAATAAPKTTATKTTATKTSTKAAAKTSKKTSTKASKKASAKTTAKTSKKTSTKASKKASAKTSKPATKKTAVPAAPSSAKTPAAPSSSWDPSTPLPVVAVKNFVDLDRIQRISRFRGGYGHDYTYNGVVGERCRSMKHYLVQKGWVRETTVPSTIRLWAPADGTIERVMQESMGSQFALAVTAQPAFRFLFHHVVFLPGLGQGSKVTAGQQLGTVATDSNHPEIGVEASTPTGTALVSFFQVASPAVLAEYAARGLASIDPLIISRAERDAHPLTCDWNTPDGRFVGAADNSVRDSAGLATFVDLN